MARRRRARLIHAFFAISLRADQIVSGFAVNFLALGITGYVFLHHYGEEGTPDGVPAVPDVTLPIDWIPFFGPALEKLNLLVWVALILVPSMSVFLFRTPTGLRVRSVGENPRAAATVGISVYWIRYLAVIASGMLAAMGGAFLSIGFVHSFNQSMTAGRGFIALAVVIVGKWRPGAALAAALLFGFTQALAQRLPVFSRELGDAAAGAALRGDADRGGRAGRALDPAGGGRRAVLEGVAGRSVLDDGVVAVAAVERVDAGPPISTSSFGPPSSVSGPSPPISASLPEPPWACRVIASASGRRHQGVVAAEHVDGELVIGDVRVPDRGGTACRRRRRPSHVARPPKMSSLSVALS